MSTTDDNSADFTLSGHHHPAELRRHRPGTDPGGEPTKATIAEVQGTTDVSPLSGKTVQVEGVVTADYRTGGYKGIVIQTQGSGGATDATPGASDGVFVFLNALAPSLEIGDLVSVTGSVSEYFGQTQLNPRCGPPTSRCSPRVSAFPPSRPCPPRCRVPTASSTRICTWLPRAVTASRPATSCSTSARCG